MRKFDLKRVAKPFHGPRGLAVIAISATTLALLVVAVIAKSSDSETTDRPRAQTLHNIDWHSADLVLPTGEATGQCPDGRQHFKRVSDTEELAHLAWAPGIQGAPNIVLDISTIVDGDLTADGRPEAVLRVWCTNRKPTLNDLSTSPSGRLLGITMAPDGALIGLGYIGPAGSRYPTFHTSDNKLVVQVWYEQSDESSSSHSIYAPAHRRTYKWGGARFDQIGGRISPLILAPSKPDRTGSPVQLTAIRSNDTVVCPAATVRFRGSTAATANADVQFEIGDSQQVDVDDDLNEELLAIVRCTVAGVATESLYLFGQQPESLVPLDLPIANSGRYLIDDHWRMSGKTLTVTVLDTANGERTTHEMTWTGAKFEGRLGHYEPGR